MLGPDGDITTDKETETEEHNTLPLNEYDEVNDQDPMEAQYEQSKPEADTGYANDDRPYFTIAYWETANEEEELMSQLYSMLKLQRIPAESVE